MSPTGTRSGRIAPGLVTVATVLCVAAVVLWRMHLPFLFTSTTTTGGDTGAHFMMPAFMSAHLFPHLTGWDPGWYDGYPAYTFYFVLPDALVALASHVIAYDVAFKLGTVLGSLLLPVAAWAFGRLFGMRPPVPAALAAATLPFLFDYTWTIYGGNLFSTLAGEYAYSLSIACMLVFLGLFARGVRTGRHRAWAAIMLAACVVAHIVPAAMAIAGAVVLTGVELAPFARHLGDDVELRPSTRATRRAVTRPAARRSRWATSWWAISTVALGLLLSAWWIVPFGLRSVYATSMNYTKVTTYLSILFPRADLWALVLAGVAVIVAITSKSRIGVVISVLGALSAAAVVLDPLPNLYNVRFLPLWFLSVYLMAGWLFAVTASALGRWARRARVSRWVHETALEPPSPLEPLPAAPGHALAAQFAPPEQVVPAPPALPPSAVPRAAHWPPGAVGGAIVALVAALAVVVPPFVPAFGTTLADIGVHPGPNQVNVWAAWNYTGYEGKAGYPEYRGLMRAMAKVGRTDGCGRAMWEYNADENRFGTPEALMLLPYWTGGCIDSMEGLLFESSATTPYHFLNQAELSESPSEAVVGLPYGGVTVPLGVRHLQLLGVRYFMASSPEVQESASADPTLHVVATSGPWSSTYQGQPLSTTWKVYEVAQSQVVTPLADDPVVLTGVGPGQTTWLGRIEPGDSVIPGPSLRWYLDPAVWHTELVTGGPASWPRTTAAHALDPPLVANRATTVSRIRQKDDSISFDVSTLGAPVLVKISYFPNWQAEGALGPWRATPNLMVVVPTRHRVTLTYGTTDATRVGDAATLLGAVVLVALFVGWLARRLRRRVRLG